MVKNLTETDKELIEFKKKFWTKMGLDSLSAELLGILFVNSKEVAMDDLAKYTGYSLASVSNKLKFLKTTKVIQKIKKPGSKKIFYFMEKDFLKIIQQKMEKSLQMDEMIKEEMPKIINHYKQEKQIEKAIFLTNYLDTVSEWIKIVQKGLIKLEKLKK